MDRAIVRHKLIFMSKKKHVRKYLSNRNSGNTAIFAKKKKKEEPPICSTDLVALKLPNVRSG